MSSSARHHHGEYFREMYASCDDPWGFDDRWYEHRKHALTVALLPRERYGCAYEPGCANGALTERLADRCDRLYASELVPEVSRRARRRLAVRDHVDVRTAAFPDWWPAKRIDLLVLSEIAYYLTPAGRRRAEQALAESLAPGGDLVAVHFTGETDYPMRGTEVAEWLDGMDVLDPLVRHIDEDFEAGVWRRRASATLDGALAVVTDSGRPEERRTR